MKKLAAIAVAACLLSSTTIAEPQPDPEFWYVTSVAAAKILLSNCPNFEWVSDTLPDFATRNRMDAVKYNAAIEGTLRASSGYDYDETALMPRVTAILRRVGANVTRALQMGGKRIVCADYAPNDWARTLENAHVIRRRSP